jgi:membrane dipeptidase
MHNTGQTNNQISHKAVIADLHCDTVIPMRRGYNISLRHDTYHIDIPRLVEGGINLQVFACSSNLVELETSSHQHVIRSIELLKNEFAKFSDSIELCLNSADIERVINENKIAAILAIEGGLALANDPRKVEYFQAKGVRIITIAHEAPVGWCANWKEADPGFNGLTDIGREMVSEMNRLGVIVDLSHSSDRTVEAVLEMTSKPVIASHSCARALCNHRRNLTDDQIKAIARSGGIVGVTFVNNFISEEYNSAYDQFWKNVSPDKLKKLMSLYSSVLPDNEYRKTLEEDFAIIIEGERKFQHLRISVADVVNHIDYMINLVGADHVAIGSDFDGMSSTQIGLEDCSRLPNIIGELKAQGYGKFDINKVMGGNFLRLFKSICD